MRNPKYLLDTTVLIDHLNRHPQATDWLLSLQDGEAVISAVTRAEVLTGCDSDQERLETAGFLDCYDCLPVTAQTADLAASLAESGPMRQNSATSELHPRAVHRTDRVEQRRARQDTR